MADTSILRQEIEAEILRLQQRLSELREQLRAIDIVEQLAAARTSPAPPPKRLPAKDDLDSFMKEMASRAEETTIADAAQYALERLGGEGHGADILKHVLEFKEIGGDHKMTSLGAAMARDDRFEKDKNRPNYWRLKKTA